MIGVPQRRRRDQVGEEEHGLLHLQGVLGEVQLGVLVEDPLLEPLELRGGFDAQLVDEVGTEAGESSECLSLSSRSLQRQHVEPVDAFPEGVVARQRPQLCQCGDVPTEGQFDLQALLERAQAHLL